MSEPWRTPMTATSPGTLGKALEAVGRRMRQPAVATDTASAWRLQIGLILAGGVVLALLPEISSPDVVEVGGLALIYGLLAWSLNLLMGTTGLVSFGHAAYFGIGAYSLALLTSRAGFPPLAALAMAPLVGAAASLIGGMIALRATELYFALLTLGLAQLVYAVAQGWYSLTGGSNGLHGQFAPSWLIDLNHVYWFILVIALLGGAVLYVITRSPFGDALRGIRENRRRAEFVGLPVKRYELGAFVIAGSIAAVAGSLYTLYQQQAYSDLTYWTSSAQPIIMCLLGGMGYFVGPMAGALFYTYLDHYVSNQTVYWDVIIGAIVLVVALALPGGLIGAVERLLDQANRLASHLARSPASREPARALPSTPAETHRQQQTPYRSTPAQPDQMPVLTVENVVKSFGALKAVDRVSLTVREGAIHAVIGPNGAGKTTLFNLITGLIRPDNGRILLRGEEVTGLAPWRLVGKGLGRSFQQTDLFWDLPVADNVALATAAATHSTRSPWGRMPADIAAEATTTIQSVGLAALRSLAANKLSHGDQRSVELAMALAVNARILLLDEPTAGLSPAETTQAIALIQRIAKERQLTVLFIEHDMNVVFDIADEITVMADSKVIAHGAPELVRNDPVVKRAYLGDE